MDYTKMTLDELKEQHLIALDKEAEWREKSDAVLSEYQVGDFKKIDEYNRCVTNEVFFGDRADIIYAIIKIDLSLNK